MSVLTHKSLAAQKHELSESKKQFDLIDNSGLERFQDKLSQTGLFPLKTIGIDTFQINMGKMCNQVCNHCHVDAGPDRKEIMTRDTMAICLEAIQKSNCSTVDLTG
ncbi:MAG: radical SAM protein, partial [Crocinitomicaceae bacterium]|nr:radical SAM protein [Crocinitomicaceae bacterium]